MVSLMSPCFILRERTLGNYWIGGWVDPRAHIGVVEERNMSSPWQELNPNSTLVQTIGQTQKT
jgi:hypothetical protein